MKIAEVISETDRILPNDIDTKTKIDWLRRLDARILIEVLNTHQKPAGYEEPDTNNYGMDTELIVQDAYAELYIHYLKMKISLELVESDRFTAETIVYNDIYSAFVKDYNRNHMPLTKGKSRYR